MTAVAARPRAGTLALATLAVTCAAQFLLVLDDTIVNVALPTIGAELGFGARSLTWVVNAYFLTFGGLLLVGGRIADRVGPRRMLRFGLAGFAAASALCGAAWSAEVLVAARGLQGVTAALLSPAALAVLLAAHPEGPARRRALAVWASLLGAGAATGLLLGGVIVETLGWRWIFYVNLPVAAATLLLLDRVVAPDAVRDRQARPNLTGAVLGTTALLLLVFTVVETDAAGWASARTLGSFALAAALGAAFAWSERRAAEPLVPRALLRRRRAMRANVAVLGAASGLLAMFFCQTLFMQRVLGFGALETGLAFMPFSVALGIGSTVAERVLATADRRWTTAGGLLVAAAGLAWMARLGPADGYLDLLPAFLVAGGGMGVALPGAIDVATGGAGEDGGLASSLVTTAQQVGGSIGIAVMITVAAGQAEAAARTGADPVTALADGLSVAFVVQAGVVAVTGLLCAAFLTGDRR